MPHLVAAFRACSLPRHTPWAPTPRALQQWASVPVSRPGASSALGHGKCSPHDRPLVRACQCQHSRPRILVGIHNCASKPERARGDRYVGRVDHASPPSFRFSSYELGGQAFSAELEVYCPLPAYGSPFAPLPNYPPLPQASLLTAVRTSTPTPFKAMDRYLFGRSSLERLAHCSLAVEHPVKQGD